MYVGNKRVRCVSDEINIKTHLSCDHCFVFLRKPLNLKGGRNH